MGSLRRFRHANLNFRCDDVSRKLLSCQPAWSYSHLPHAVSPLETWQAESLKKGAYGCQQSDLRLSTAFLEGHSAPPEPYLTLCPIVTFCFVFNRLFCFCVAFLPFLEYKIHESKDSLCRDMNCLYLVARKGPIMH